MWVFTVPTIQSEGVWEPWIEGVVTKIVRPNAVVIGVGADNGY